MTTTRVKGLSELQKFLNELPAKMEQNVLRGGLRAGANVVAPVVKANAPKDTGLLAQGVKVRTGARRGRVTASIRLTGPHAFLGKWLEYGTAAHRIVAKDGGWLFVGLGFAKAVDHPGITPRPFMGPALIQNAQAATVAAAKYMRNRLQSRHGLDTSDIEIEAVE